MIALIVVLYIILFFTSYLLMSLRRKVLNLTYGPMDCDPTLFLSAACPPFGILFALADLLAYSLGLRQPGYYFNGERCRTPR